MLGHLGKFPTFIYGLHEFLDSTEGKGSLPVQIISRLPECTYMNVSIFKVTGRPTAFLCMCQYEILKHKYIVCTDTLQGSFPIYYNWPFNSRPHPNSSHQLHTNLGSDGSQLQPPSGGDGHGVWENHWP